MSWQELYRLPLRLVAFALIYFYRFFLSPIFGGSCRFHPSCSQYALICFEEMPPLKALYYTVRRLGRCQPWCEGGFDYPPGHTPEEHHCDEHPKAENHQRPYTMGTKA